MYQRRTRTSSCSSVSSTTSTNTSAPSPPSLKYPTFTQALRKANSSKNDDQKDKNLANFASKLTYNESILEKKGLGVLGKREESESDLIANFYQECGIEEFSRNRSESVSKQFGLRGKPSDEWLFGYEDKPRKRDLLRKYDPRIRGIIRLGEKLSMDGDIYELSQSILGSRYSQHLAALQASLLRGELPDAFPSEQAINNNINDIIANKKLQKRVMALVEGQSKAKLNPEESEANQKLLCSIVKLILQLPPS
jgi:hypothetical protein